MTPLLAYAPALARGAGTTLEVAALALAIGLAGGLAGGLASRSRLAAVRLAVRGVTGLLRGVPEFVILLVGFFALSGALWHATGGAVSVSPLLAGSLALGLTFSAYASEALRGALAAVGRGQEEAALALGLSDATLLRTVVLPQALRLAVPSLGNQWQALLKDTSLVSVIGLPDLMRTADTGGQASGEPFTFLLAAAAIYFVFGAVSQPVQSALERRARRGIAR